MVQNLTPPTGAAQARAARPLALPSRSELALGASLALDLASFHEPGHGQRVAYIALRIGEAAGCPPQVRGAAFYASLFHHVGLRFSGEGPEWRPLTTGAARPGMPVDLCAWGSPDALRLGVGDSIVQRLSIPPAAAEAVAAVRERWDGGGAPGGLAGEETPLAARIVALADYLESCAAGFANPLRARFSVRDACRNANGTLADPALAEAALELLQHDDFWIGLYDAQIGATLAESRLRPAERARDGREQAANFALSFVALVDARTGHGAGHSQGVATLARGLALALGYDEDRVEALWLAGLWHDIGALAVPDKILAKPDLLTVEEMDLVRAHPQHARQIFEALPALAPMAGWVGAHHERLDGKGYPDGLAGEELPAEAQVLGIADTFSALTSDRPYRRAMSREEAIQVLRAQAGLQFDSGLVELLESIVT